MRKYLLFNFLLLILPFSIVCEVTAQKKKDVATVDFCELVNNPKIYDQKIVRTQAIYASNMHGASIYDYRCKNGDAAMGIGGDERSKQIKTKKEISRKFDEVVNKRANESDNRAYVTVIGKFYDWNGTGYGAFSHARFQFNIFAFEGVEPVKPNTPWKTEESEFMAEVEHLRYINLKWNEAYLGSDIENIEEILAADYIFKDLQGKAFDKSKFLETSCASNSTTDKKGGAAIRGGNVFIDGNKASITGETISYACPTTIICQYQYENHYAKQNGQWKLITTQITSNKTTLEMFCGKS